jgi:hypothetical protein
MRRLQQTETSTHSEKLRVHVISFKFCVFNYSLYFQFIWEKVIYDSYL